MLADASAPGRIEGPHRARIVVQPAIPLPARSRVDASGTSQVPRQSILCLCPGPGPRPNRRTLANGGLVDAAPALSTAEASALSYRGYRGASAPAVYASRMMLPPPVQDSLPAGWLAFAGRELNPLDCDERFPSCYILFPLSWIYPDATKADFPRAQMRFRQSPYERLLSAAAKCAIWSA